MIDFIILMCALVIIIGILAVTIFVVYTEGIVRWTVKMDDRTYNVTKAVKRALELESPYTGKRIFSGCLEYIKYWPTIDDPVIIKLAKGLVPYVKDMTDFDKATFILRFVQQNTRYITDVKRFGSGNREKWVFPVDTLKARKGDCEDTSFLCVALMHLMGLDAVTVSLPGHICVGVYLPEVVTGMKYEYNGKLYRHVETIDDTQIGDFVKFLGEPDCIRVPELPNDEFKSRLRP